MVLAAGNIATKLRRVIPGAMLVRLYKNTATVHREVMAAVRNGENPIGLWAIVFADRLCARKILHFGKTERRIFMSNSNPEISGTTHYIEIDGQQVLVTEEVYRAYKRPLWSEHKRKERGKRCRDVAGRRCPDDCSQCSKQRTGSVLSLDKLTEDGFDIADPIDFTQFIEDQEVIEALHIALDELDPLDRQIVNLFSTGKSEREIAAVVGMSQKGINRRKVRIFAELRERLKNIL